MTTERALQIFIEIYNGKTMRNIKCCTRAFHNFCANNPDYGLIANVLLERNRKLSDYGKGAWRRSKTHCKNGHELVVVSNVSNDRKRRCIICEQQREQRRKAVRNARANI